ncbi:hypothetical protein G7Y79_00026g058620 [Physcia stellaris]|nr:hypothetical protein G7Y79_00026g058620 [Physcia stellaris]
MGNPSQEYEKESHVDRMVSNDVRDGQSNSRWGAGSEGMTVENTARIKRIFNFAQIFSFSLTFMSTWESVCGNLYFALYNGGPQTFAWSILIAYAGALAQSASLAEMASTQPIAGAQYHWTHALAPTGAKRFITWIQGWVTWWGWISLLAGVSNLTAIILQNMVALNDPSYVSKQWHIVLLIYAVVVTGVLVNIFTYKLVPKIELLAGICHVCLFIIFMVVLVVLGEQQRHTAEYVFLQQTVESGWTNTFVAWNIGMLTCTWSFTGFDGALHMSEEVRKAKHAVPRALFWTIALNGIMAYGMVLALLFASGSLTDVLESSLPVLVILQNLTGSTKATTALVCGLFIISYCVGLASIASVSRLTWAWARDGGLPATFAYVSLRFRVPIRAVLLPAGIVMLLALLNIGNTAAFGAIIALSSLALYFSYFIAIGCMVYARFNKAEPLKLGGWNLGRWGLWINAFALLYTLWIMIFLPFPSTLPVTGSNMNYAGPIFGVVLLFAISLWVLLARKRWAGPNVAIIEYVVTAER